MPHGPQTDTIFFPVARQKRYNFAMERLGRLFEFTKLAVMPTVLGTAMRRFFPQSLFGRLLWVLVLGLLLAQFLSFVINF